jgi:type II secretory pathway pseudopilin PulG
MSAVIAVIVLLAALSVAGWSAWRARTREARADADLLLLRLGFERFREAYGVYPEEITGQAVPFDCLMGKREPDGSFLQHAHPSFLPPGQWMLKEEVLLDPWGNAYRYAHDAALLPGTYVLFSCGPDGLCHLDAGAPDPTQVWNFDNRDGLP